MGVTPLIHWLPQISVLSILANCCRLRQIDEAYLERLGEAGLRALLIKAMEDLKEAREQLNQNSHNSTSLLKTPVSFTLNKVYSDLQGFINDP